jgi:hypothetical protein
MCVLKWFMRREALQWLNGIYFLNYIFIKRDFFCLIDFYHKFHAYFFILKINQTRNNMGMVNATAINQMHFWKTLKMVFRTMKRVLAKLQSSYEVFLLIWMVAWIKEKRFQQRWLSNYQKHKLNSLKEWRSHNLTLTSLWKNQVVAFWELIIGLQSYVGYIVITSFNRFLADNFKVTFVD